jgi:hypothetical protein
MKPCFRAYLANARHRELLKEASDIDLPFALPAACLDHRMKAVLNPREHFGLASEDCHNLGVCLLDEANMTEQELSPSGQTCPVVRRS